MQNWKYAVHLACIYYLLTVQCQAPPRCWFSHGDVSQTHPPQGSSLASRCGRVSDLFPFLFQILFKYVVFYFWIWEKNILKLGVVVKGVFRFLFVVLGLAGRLSRWDLSAPLGLWISSVSPFLRVAVVELWNCSTVWFSFVWNAQDAFLGLWCYPFLCSFLCVCLGTWWCVAIREGPAAALSHQRRPLPRLGFVFTEMFPLGQREECW